MKVDYNQNCSCKANAVLTCYVLHLMLGIFFCSHFASMCLWNLLECATSKFNISYTVSSREDDDLMLWIPFLRIFYIKSTVSLIIRIVGIGARKCDCNCDAMPTQALKFSRNALDISSRIARAHNGNIFSDINVAFFFQQLHSLLSLLSGVFLFSNTYIYTICYYVMLELNDKLVVM